VAVFVRRFGAAADFQIGRDVTPARGLWENLQDIQTGGGVLSSRTLNILAQL
jgi:hypothetical protein